MIKKNLIVWFTTSCMFLLNAQGPDNGFFDLRTIPFSKPGSFYSIKRIDNKSGLLEITTSKRSAVTYRWDPHPAWANSIFKIKLRSEGGPVSYKTKTTPWELVLTPKSKKGWVKVTFGSNEELLFEVRDLELELESYRSLKGVYKKSNNEAGFVPHFSKAVAQIKIYGNGSLQTKDKSFVIKNVSDLVALRLSDFPKPWPEKSPDYKQKMEAFKKEWKNWMNEAPGAPEKFHETRDVAWYLMKNMVVGPYENYSRQAILMSKMGMNQIWAWDNCINAVAVAKADPKLAWDQIQIFFDKQTSTGMIPDPINDYSNQYGFTKPPIQGWAILKMIELQGEETALPFIKDIYEPMNNYIQWWYADRDINDNGLLEYFNGVDSGWDNATVFDHGGPIEGPDLAAYMIVQFEAMSKMAKLLKKTKEAKYWRLKQESHLQLLLGRFLTQKNRFGYPKINDSLTGMRESSSLITYVPLMLGNLLPKTVVDSLATDLLSGGKYMTAYGLASESPSSTAYTSDGYWRGPIWAPSTLLIFDGLVKSGRTEQAKEVARRFCQMVAQDNGFYENYDALTGAGLRDKGYSWTAASFLIMAKWLATIE